MPGIDVIFLDTGYHFPETIGTRDAVDFVYDVNVRTVLPLLTVAEQDAAEGKDLWRTDPDRCCALLGLEPSPRSDRYAEWAAIVHPDDLVATRALMRAAATGRGQRRRRRSGGGGRRRSGAWKAHRNARP